MCCYTVGRVRLENETMIYYDISFMIIHFRLRKLRVYHCYDGNKIALPLNDEDILYEVEFSDITRVNTILIAVV